MNATPDELYTARRRNLRVSPRKLRLAADLIRGKELQDAIDALDFSVTKGSRMMLAILDNAFANAEAQNADIDRLVVHAVTVNQGRVFRRFKPSARGRQRGNCHRHSHVDLHLAVRRDQRFEKALAQRAEAAATAAASDKED